MKLGYWLVLLFASLTVSAWLCYSAFSSAYHEEEMYKAQSDEWKAQEVACLESPSCDLAKWDRLNPQPVLGMDGLLSMFGSAILSAFLALVLIATFPGSTFFERRGD